MKILKRLNRKRIASWVLFADLDLHDFYIRAAKNEKLDHIVKGPHVLKLMRPASLFEMAIVAVPEQQISLVTAYNIRSRMIRRFGDSIEALWTFPRQETLAQASKDQLMACGMSKRKAEYIRELSLKVVEGSIDLTNLKETSDEEVLEYIISLRGLGKSECLLTNDLAVRTTGGKYLGDGACLMPAQVKRALEPFVPYRGITAFYLLAYERLKQKSYLMHLHEQ